MTWTHKFGTKLVKNKQELLNNLFISLKNQSAVLDCDKVQYNTSTVYSGAIYATMLLSVRSGIGLINRPSMRNIIINIQFINDIILAVSRTFGRCQQLHTILALEISFNLSPNITAKKNHVIN